MQKLNSLKIGLPFKVVQLPTQPLIRGNLLLYQEAWWLLCQMPSPRKSEWATASLQCVLVAYSFLESHSVESERHHHFLGPAILLLENKCQQTYRQSHYTCRIHSYFEGTLDYRSCSADCLGEWHVRGSFWAIWTSPKLSEHHRSSPRLRTQGTAMSVFDERCLIQQI